ncbi:MAG: PAS domain S-box protein, partial [Acidobacteria bacterium]|nr:PAS domain S-box protein [Acidobacteriota bacterium]
MISTLLESSPDGIIVQTLDGIVTIWNPGAERIYGYTEREALGQAVIFLAPWDRKNEIADILRRVREGKPIDQLETVRLHKDGHPVHVALSIAPIRDRSGEMIGISEFARDISPRQHTEERLRQAERMDAVGRLCGSLAHEFNNILTIISGYTDAAIS